MKPTSIVALIVSVVIIVAGIVTCVVADNMAKTSGNLLFSETRGDDSVKTVDLSSKEVNRISLDFTDADVNIYGSGTTSYIEFVNFSETLYSLSVTNTSISFSEIPDISSMLKFWENGFSFKGMRYILNPRSYDNTKMKSVNIYLADGYDVKQFTVTADKTTVTLENLSCAADYIITANEVKVSSSFVRTPSTLRINSEKNSAPANTAKVSFDHSSFGAVAINAGRLDLIGETNDATGISVSCKNGTIDWELPHYSASAFVPMNIRVETAGELEINGNTESSPFEFDNTSGLDAVGCSVNISAGNANVTLDKITLSEQTEPIVQETDAVITEPAD